MNKNAILIALLARYASKAFTHNYIMGFIYKGVVYSMTCVGLTYGIKLDQASSKNGGGYSIRFAPTEADKKAAVESGQVEMVCSESYFKELVADSKYNAGEIFEKLMTEKAGQVWEKDNVPFYEGADLTTDGKAYSIKFQKATICTEKTLNRIGA